VYIKSEPPTPLIQEIGESSSSGVKVLYGSHMCHLYVYVFTQQEIVDSTENTFAVKKKKHKKHKESEYEQVINSTMVVDPVSYQHSLSSKVDGGNFLLNIMLEYDCSIRVS